MVGCTFAVRRPNEKFSANFVVTAITGTTAIIRQTSNQETDSVSVWDILRALSSEILLEDRSARNAE
jgi:hypothetical protein